MSFREANGDASRDTIRHRRVVVADGGRLPISPRRFLEEQPAFGFTSSALPPGNHERQEGWSMLRERERALGSNDQDYYSTYIVDKNGNEYEPYSLAWRYLGMYMDCDHEECADDDDGDCDTGRKRRLRDGRHLGGSNDGGGNCERMLLWAAYVDHHYRGHSIGGYQFYDVEAGEYDQSMCHVQRWKLWDRCKRLDCHDLNPTNFELIGVFKETDGLSDWAEQLFKHQAYCIWDDDTYETMQNRRERWPNQCWQLYYFYDSNGNSLYVDLQPLPEGNVTMGIYTDDKCSQVADVTWFDYISYYYSKYGDSDRAEAAIEGWNQTIQSWNDGMTPFKKCQPCRAYSLDPTSPGGSQYEEQNSHDRQERWLGEDNQNDGEGGEEQNGYDCYDAAGYTNCNQCYKFFAKTDLELASADDLALASDTILSIRVDGVLYGSGGFRSPPEPASYALLITGAALGIAVGLFVVGVYVRYRSRLRVMPQSLKEELVAGAANGKEKKKKKSRAADTDDASAYTEYTTSCEDDDSRGVEKFKATRLALSRSIDRVSDYLKVAVSESLDMAAHLLPGSRRGRHNREEVGSHRGRHNREEVGSHRGRHNREEVAMPQNRAVAVYLLPDSVSRRLDMVVDYILPISSPEETGEESNYDSSSQYAETTSFPDDEDDEEMGYASNIDDEQHKAGATWIELPLQHQEEIIEVSSIEGLTTEVGSDGKERLPAAQQNGSDGPQTSHDYTESSFSSESDVSSSSAYESPDEAVLYHPPGARIQDPLENQQTSDFVATDKLFTRCGAIKEGSEEADASVTITIGDDDDDAGDAVMLSISPTNETGDTARVQKSACDSCLTALALDSFPSSELTGSTDASKELVSGDIQTSHITISPSSGIESNSKDETLNDVPAVDEPGNRNLVETKLDQTDNESKTAVVSSLSALALDSCPSKERNRRTDASEQWSDGDRQTSIISSSPANRTKSEYESSIDRQNVDESDNANGEMKSDGAGNEGKAAVKQSKSKTAHCSLPALDLGTAPADRADDIVPMHARVKGNHLDILHQTDKRETSMNGDDCVTEEVAVHKKEVDCAIGFAETPESQGEDFYTSSSASADTVDVNTGDNDSRHDHILLDAFISNNRSSPAGHPPAIDPSGTYNMDSGSVLEDPSGTYTVHNQSFLSNPTVLNASSILAVPDEDEGDSGDGGAYHVVDYDTMTENPTDTPEQSSAVDDPVRTDPSCSASSCWALLALDDDGPPVGTLPPAAATATTTTVSPAVESITDPILDSNSTQDAEDDTILDSKNFATETENPTDRPERSSAVDDPAGVSTDPSCSTSSCWALLALDDDDPPVGTVPPAAATATDTTISPAVVEISTDPIVDNNSTEDAEDVTILDSKNFATENPTDIPERSSAVDVPAAVVPTDPSCSTSSCWALLALDDDDPPVGTVPPAAATRTTTICNAVESITDPIVDSHSTEDEEDDTILDRENFANETKNPTNQPERSSAVYGPAAGGVPTDPSCSTSSCWALLALENDGPPVGTPAAAAAAAATATATTISPAVVESITDPIVDNNSTEQDAKENEDDAARVNNGENTGSLAPPNATPQHPGHVHSHDTISEDNGSSDTKSNGAAMDPPGQAAKLSFPTSHDDRLVQTTPSHLEVAAHLEGSHAATVGGAEVVELDTNNPDAAKESTACDKACLECFALD